jgi:hypothetical protein
MTTTEGDCALSISRTTTTAILAAALVAAAATSWTAAASGDRSEAQIRAGGAAPHSLDTQLTQTLRATARYATDLARAERDGYRIITRPVPGLGVRLMNPSVKGFDVRKPAILVFEQRAGGWQLGAVEWVFQGTPARPPLSGARYTSLAAGCSYADGSFVAAGSRKACPGAALHTGAAFTLWHPTLRTMRVWLWAPNPRGLFTRTNPSFSYESPLALAFDADAEGR